MTLPLPPQKSQHGLKRVWNAFTKRAKDMGSAAVMLSLVFCAGVWGTALYRWSTL